MRTVHNSGRPDRVIVLSRNSQFEALSSISRDDALAIADAPGVKRTTDGKPVVSAEALSSILVTKKSRCPKGTGRSPALLKAVAAGPNRKSSPIQQPYSPRCVRMHSRA
jgi:hypothetical protein